MLTLDNLIRTFMIILIMSMSSFCVFARLKERRQEKRWQEQHEHMRKNNDALKPTMPKPINESINYAANASWHYKNQSNNYAAWRYKNQSKSKIADNSKETQK